MKLERWYEDRDFPEVKTSNSDIVAVIENKDQRRRVIREHNDLVNKILDMRHALGTVPDEHLRSCCYGDGSPEEEFCTCARRRRREVIKAAREI